jgi:hypothetical protein
MIASAGHMAQSGSQTNFLTAGLLRKRLFFPAIHQGAHEHGVMEAAHFVLDFINRVSGIGIENLLKPVLKNWYPLFIHMLTGPTI